MNDTDAFFVNDMRKRYEARIAELEAKVEHDEDNLEGLQHALVRANQRYTQAEAALAERDRMLQEAWKLRGKLSSYETFLDSLRTRAEEGSGDGC